MEDKTIIQSWGKQDSRSGILPSGALLGSEGEDRRTDSLPDREGKPRSVCEGHSPERHIHSN